jgi:small subunit ribosomal protein S1
MVVEGTISNIVDFGAFVDLDGIDGLIHISELSWTHINHPSEVLQVNQKVKVKVLDIDRDRQRISLGLKQTQEDPWTRIVSEHRVGDILEGRVTKLVAFGAFVEIYAGIEGLVHISELANRHVERPDEIVQVNEIIAVKIIEIDSDRRRLSLSIKRVDGAPMMRHPASEEADAAAGEAAAGEAGEAEAGTDEPAADETVAAETEAAETEVAETAADETVAKESAAEETAADEPAAEEPAAEEPAAEEPAAEESAAEEPAAEESAAEEPASEEPAAEEPESTTAVGADEPTPELGLSDDVFPVGAEPADEKAAADDTPADDAEAAAGEEA